jgi:SAM-dependent MidA family methyltransferase
MSIVRCGVPVALGVAIRFRDHCVQRDNPMRTSLPAPTPAQAAHSAKVAEAITNRIVANGPLRFDAFMDLALYAPGLGYYSAGATKIGRDGDFTTAPELGSVFARCLAEAVAPELAPTGADVVELGAGTGALAVGLLTALATLGRLPARYRIVEVSADLRDRQQLAIGTLDESVRRRVEWLDAPPDAAWHGALIANEVVDALPCRLFEQRKAGLVELGVAVDGGGRLAWHDLEPDAALVAEIRGALDDGRERPDPYRSEIRPQIPAWLNVVAGRLVRGLAIFVDYGFPRAEYYLPARSSGTLRCHYRHRAHDDPLVLVGLQDLTASVDFTQLADAGRASGFDVACYATQAAFLLASGLPRILGEAASADPMELVRLGAEVRTLTLPGEMGERFKVLALSRGLDPSTLPFVAADSSPRL